MAAFGAYLNQRRTVLNSRDPGCYSLRKVAARAGINPSYLSQIENGKQSPPGEDTIVRLAGILEEDADVLLAMAGKVSSELQAIIARRPRLFSQLLRSLKNEPDHAILHLVREVRDGSW
ncbi:MAG: helix-turn-helix domain-containing protein [Akkermansiaceae bacterium]|nr:helix-turn-helix domain-containing protein [Akkermansiaceae bacterium]